MRKLLLSRTGSMFIYTIIILTFLLTFSGLVCELYRIHSIQTHVEYEIQRAVNIAVEDAMKDSWRQDTQGRLDTVKAVQSMYEYFNVWLGLNSSMEKRNGGTLVYTIQLGPVSAAENPPRLSVSGKIIIPSAYPYLVTNAEVLFDISSRNRRSD